MHFLSVIVYLKLLFNEYYKNILKKGRKEQQSLNSVLERMGIAGVVPVVVIEDVKNAVPTANALLTGGISVMEITLRTKAGLDSIKAILQNNPDMLVGAGTVLTLEQTKQCVEVGAEFIVSPGFNKAQVEWCVKNDVTVTPGCVTPTEIMQALDLGVSIFKFFPAKIYGGLEAIKALAGPFGNVKFIPTGGVNAENLDEFAASPYVHAVGGSWICTKADIAAGNFDKITALCAKTMKTLMGFEFGHLGINMPDADQSLAVMRLLVDAFGLDANPGNSSNFAGSAFEIMKSKYLGNNGHIAIKTNNISRAVSFLSKRGFFVDMETAKYKDDKMLSVYLKDDFGGFAAHLLQK